MSKQVFKLFGDGAKANEKRIGVVNSLYEYIKWIELTKRNIKEEVIHDGRVGGCEIFLVLGGGVDSTEKG